MAVFIYRTDLSFSTSGLQNAMATGNVAVIGRDGKKYGEHKRGATDLNGKNSVWKNSEHCKIFGLSCPDTPQGTASAWEPCGPCTICICPILQVGIWEHSFSFNSLHFRVLVMTREDSNPCVPQRVECTCSLPLGS